MVYISTVVLIYRDFSSSNYCCFFRDVKLYTPSTYVYIVQQHDSMTYIHINLSELAARVLLVRLQSQSYGYATAPCLKMCAANIKRSPKMRDTTKAALIHTLTHDRSRRHALSYLNHNKILSVRHRLGCRPPVGRLLTRCRCRRRRSSSLSSFSLVPRADMNRARGSWILGPCKNFFCLSVRPHNFVHSAESVEFNKYVFHGSQIHWRPGPCWVSPLVVARWLRDVVTFPFTIGVGKSMCSGVAAQDQQLTSTMIAEGEGGLAGYSYWRSNGGQCGGRCVLVRKMNGTC